MKPDMTHSTGDTKHLGNKKERQTHLRCLDVFMPTSMHSVSKYVLLEISQDVNLSLGEETVVFTY